MKLWVNIMGPDTGASGITADDLRELARTSGPVEVFSTELGKRCGRVVRYEMREGALYAELELEPGTPDFKRAAGMAYQKGGRWQIAAVLATDLPRELLETLGNKEARRAVLENMGGWKDYADTMALVGEAMRDWALRHPRRWPAFRMPPDDVSVAMSLDRAIDLLAADSDARDMLEAVVRATDGQATAAMVITILQDYDRARKERARN